MLEKIEQIKKIKHSEYILLSLILVLAFLARLYKINNPIADWHSWRQADTASVSKVYVQRGIDFLYPRYHDISTTQTRIFNPEGYRFVEFPIFNAIHAFFASNLPFLSIELWGRLVSVLSSLVTVYILFLIGNSFIGRWGGLLASAYFAFLPYNIYFSRVILPEPLATTFVVLSLWMFVKYLDNERTATLFFSSLLFSLALLVKPFTIFYGVPIVYLAIRKYGFKGTFASKKLRLAFILSVVPFLLWRIWMNRFPEGIPLWRWAFNEDGIRFRPAFWRWIFGERLGRLILGIWGLIPFGFGVLAYKKNKAFIHIFLLAMFLYVSVIATANVKHDYYQTMTIPAVALALAQGTIEMWNSKKSNQKVVRGLLIFSLFLMFNLGAYQVKGFYQINRPEIIEAGKAVDRLTPEDALVIAAYNGDTAFLYQTNRWGWPVVDRPIDELIDKGAGYYVSVDLQHPQTIEFSQRFEIVEKSPEYIILDLNKETGR